MQQGVWDTVFQNMTKHHFKLDVSRTKKIQANKTCCGQQMAKRSFVKRDITHDYLVCSVCGKTLKVKPNNIQTEVTV